MRRATTQTFRHRQWLVAFAIGLSACSNVTGDEVTVADVSPLPALNGQLGTVATSLPDSIGVRVLDQFGEPLANVPVRWEVTAGGGRVEPSETLTDRLGIARATWRLDTIAGVQRSFAVVQGYPTRVQLDARGLPGSVATLRFVDTTAMQVAVGRSSVRATTRIDAYGNVHPLGAPVWRSADPAIAVVNNAGVVSGQRAGSTWIVATQDGGRDSLLVRVVSDAAAEWLAVGAGGTGIGGHTCAVDGEARIWCWGYNDGGQLGTGTIVPRTAPAPTAQLPSVRFRSVRGGTGASRLTCALSENGDAYCWGESSVGDGSASRRVPTRVLVSGGVTFSEIDVGRDHACAVSTDGALYCWGVNTFGQTGDASGDTVRTPRRVGGIDSVTSIALGSESTCAASVRGVVWCWGRNSRGELATGDTLAVAQPRQVAGLTGVTALVSGDEHRCAIAASGLWCWGRNDVGQVGDGSATDRRQPIRAHPASTARYVALDGGTRHSCAVTEAGAVDCWGANADGQLGTGDTRNATEPQRVTALAGLPVRALALAGNTSCALTRAGELYCWGSDSQGQLGNGPAPAPQLPIRIDRP
jgi:alpha-tubulin suppressor-like RCC1 family protein